MASSPETPQPPAAATPRRTPAARRKTHRHRGEGQWAKGHFTPLNGTEQPAQDEGKTGGGSTDVGDVSWITPTVQVHATTYPAGIPGHSWGITATGATSIGHKGMLHAAKAMALTGAALFMHPEEIEKAQAEFKDRTDGKPYKSPIPDGIEPPVPAHVRAQARAKA